MSEHVLTLEKFQEIAADLSVSESCTFFNDYIKLNPTCCKNLFNTFTSMSAVQSIKTTIPDFGYVDVILYAYFMPRSVHTTDQECFDYYLNKKREKKDYYNRIKTLDNGDIKVASINITNYVTDNWLILRNAYDNKESAIKDLVNKINSWGRTGNKGGIALIKHPLISAMTPNKVIMLFLLDVGMDIYRYLLSHPTEEKSLISVPSHEILQGFVSFQTSKVPAEVELVDKNTVHLLSKEYRTIFSIINAPVDKFMQSVDQKSFSYPNITTADLSNLINIYNAYTPEDFKTGIKNTTLGELASLTGDYAKKHNKKREIVDLLKSIYKWSSYSFNISNNGRKRIMTFMSAEIGYDKDSASVSENDNISSSTALQSSEPQYALGYRFDEDEYQRLSFDELKNIPITISLNNILLNDREKYITQELFSDIYNMIKNANTKAVFAFLYQKKMEDISKSSPLVFTIKDLRQSFAASKTRANKLASFIENSLQELKELNALSDFSYDANFKAFSVTEFLSEIS